jgi:hypothetical protein
MRQGKADQDLEGNISSPARMLGVTPRKPVPVATGMGFGGYGYGFLGSGGSGAGSTGTQPSLLLKDTKVLIDIHEMVLVSIFLPQTGS